MKLKRFQKKTFNNPENLDETWVYIIWCITPLVVLIVWLGLPHIKRDPPKLDELIFVKLADVAKVTNLPPDMDTQPKKKSKTKSANTKQSTNRKGLHPRKQKTSIN